MTYDVKVYGARGPLNDSPSLGDYAVVLAVAAEAHEKAAVEAAYKLGAAAAFGIEREQAIRDCADDLDARVVRERDEGDGDGLLAGMEYAVECVRALLEGGKS